MCSRDSLVSLTQRRANPSTAFLLRIYNLTEILRKHQIQQEMNSSVTSKSVKVTRHKENPETVAGWRKLRCQGHYQPWEALAFGGV